MPLRNIALRQDTHARREHESGARLGGVNCGLKHKGVCIRILNARRHGYGCGRERETKKGGDQQHTYMIELFIHNKPPEKNDHFQSPPLSLYIFQKRSIVTLWED